MTSSQTLSATLRQVRVTSKQLCSVARWMFWHSRSCWVNLHRPRAPSSTAWALRLASIGSYPSRQLGNDIHVRLRHPASPFRPTFTISSFLARSQALYATLSQLFRPSTWVSASARLGSLISRWTRILPSRGRESLLGRLGRLRDEAARGGP